MKYWAQLTCENILDREKKSQENKKHESKNGGSVVRSYNDCDNVDVAVFFTFTV